MKLAGMGRLSYESRIEVVVQFYCDEWDELVNLLEAPLEYMRAQQFLWKQQPEASTPWQLLAPVTATLNYGGSSPQLTERVLSFLDTTQFMDLDFHESSFEENVAKLQDSFYVEFAIYTSSINIIYYQPSSKTLEAHAKGRIRGGTEIMSPSLVWAENKQFKSANLHFDLAIANARTRAEFVVSFIEDSTTFVNALNALAKKSEVYKVASSLKEIGEEITLEPATPTNKKDLPKMPEGTVFLIDGFDAQGKRVFPDDFDFSNFDWHTNKTKAYTTITVENLSTDYQTSVCGNITANIVVNNKIIFVKLTCPVIHTYEISKFDPESLIRNNIKKGARNHKKT